VRKRLISALLIVVALVTELSVAANATTRKTDTTDYFPYSAPMDYTATYYVETGNPTASGVMPRGNNTIAVDRELLQSLGYDFGATAIIYYDNEFVGYFVAEDTGGLIKGYKIDIYIDDTTDLTTDFYKDLMWYGRVNIVIQWVDAKG
jgi:3D (Asp-Asp-Asp) domain-containing protein